MTEPTDPPKTKRKSPNISSAQRLIITEKRNATREANWITKGNAPRPPKPQKPARAPREIKALPSLDESRFSGNPNGRPKEEKKTKLIKGASENRDGYVCHFDSTHPHLTAEELNNDPEYGLRGRTFSTLQLKAAQKYHKENPGSSFTKIFDYYDRDFAEPERDPKTKKIIGRQNVIKPGAEKHLSGYLVTTPNKKATSQQMFSTLHLVQK